MSQAIKGYRDLSQAEIDAINRVKTLGDDLKAACKEASDLIEEANRVHGIGDSEAYRWVAIARTHFQEGMMALVRSIARPEHF
ncbi:MAG TPA: hypothetical protein VN679_15130 [Candidatus Acidoferrales bacterium]|nr:hypothetical protein [Candidatus Acidoferrales bacterium]